jgi:creatinine amidohydrolase
VLVLNGHGGNDCARARLYEVASELKDVRLVWYAWFQSHSVLEVAQRHGLKPAHASWLEAFSFTQVGELPAGEKTPPRIPGLLGADEARQVYDDGVFGGPYQVDEAIMQEVFAAALQDILVALRFE